MDNNQNDQLPQEQPYPVNPPLAATGADQNQPPSPPAPPTLEPIQPSPPEPPDERFSTYDFPSQYQPPPPSAPVQPTPAVVAPEPARPQKPPVIPQAQPDSDAQPISAHPSTWETAQPTAVPLEQPAPAQPPAEPSNTEPVGPSYPAYETPLAGTSPAPMEPVTPTPAHTEPVISPPALSATPEPATAGGQLAQPSSTPNSSAYVSYSPPPLADHSHSEQVVSTPVALGPLSQAQKVQTKLKQRVQGFSKANLRSKLKPLLSAALVGILIYGVFNSQLILGQIQYLISPGANADSPAVVDINQAVSAEAEIIIPKINLRVPVVYDVKTFDEKAVQKGLERGVVHYGTTALPGQRGNNVIVGHSSNNWWASGKYKFAFVLLNKLEDGDNFYLHYESKRYTYEVTSKEIVEPTDTSVLNQNVSTPVVSLITCDPPGTSWKRLVVQAKQIEPDPTRAAPPTSEGSPDNNTPLPGDGRSFFDVFRGLFS